MAKKEGFEGMLETDGAEEEAVAVEQPTNALALYQDRPEFNPDDVLIPQLRLAQGLTAEVQDGNARPGQWLLTGFGPEEDVTVIPLMFARMRELRDPDDRSIKCFSRDGSTGVGDPGGDCSKCPMAQWQGDEGSRSAPPCNFMYAYMVYSVTHDALAIMRFSKTGLRAGKLLNTMVARSGLGNVAAKVASDGRKGPRGTFHVPVVNPAKVPQDMLDNAKARLAQGF